MMIDFTLSWDLVLLTVLVILSAYHFLLGQNATIKLILSIYIAILTADGFARAIKRFITDPSPGFQQLMGEHQDEIFIVLRLMLFLFAIVIFVVRGGFSVRLVDHDHWAVRLGIHTVFSLLGAVLFLSTILIYLSGNSFVEGLIFAGDSEVYNQSSIAKTLVNYYQIWFSLPAITFLIGSFFFEQE